VVVWIGGTVAEIYITFRGIFPNLDVPRGVSLFYFYFFYFILFFYYFFIFFDAPVAENPSPGSLSRGSGSLKLAAQHSSAPGKRDKYRYEVECVTDVPIGCILNR
jgi:hypothetical protein